MTDADFLAEAVSLARTNVVRGGRPFGAVVVKDGAVIGRGVNEIAATGDPTAHAELLAIRAAARSLGTPRLDGCVVYASGQPCPMCQGAMYLTGVSEFVFAYSNEDAEPFGLSTQDLSAELAKPPSVQRLRRRQLTVDSGLYAEWKALSASKA